MKKKILKAAVLCATAAMMTAGAMMTAMAGLVTDPGNGYNALQLTPGLKWKIDGGDWADVDLPYYCFSRYFKDDATYSEETAARKDCLYIDSVYKHKDGTLFKGWHWLDDDLDGMAECYYFEDDGTMFGARYYEKEGAECFNVPVGVECKYNNVTPDGYTIDNEHQTCAWTVDGVIQQRKVIYNVDPDPEVTKLLTEYNEDGKNLGLLNMMGKTRKDNERYGEIAIDESLVNINGDRLHVYYANGVKCEYDANTVWRGEEASMREPNLYGAIKNSARKDWVYFEDSGIDRKPFTDEAVEIFNSFLATLTEEERLNYNYMIRHTPYPYESKLK